MLTGPQVILTLKVLVATVTVLLIASLVALALGKPRWHGRINTVFFALTMLTVFGFEMLIQFKVPDNTGGATFYHDTSLEGPPAAWGAVRFTVQHGNLKFYARGGK